MVTATFIQELPTDINILSDENYKQLGEYLAILMNTTLRDCKQLKMNVQKTIRDDIEFRNLMERCFYYIDEEGEPKYHNTEDIIQNIYNAVLKFLMKKGCRNANGRGFQGRVFTDFTTLVNTIRTSLLQQSQRNGGSGAGGKRPSLPPCPTPSPPPNITFVTVALILLFL